MNNRRERPALVAHFTLFGIVAHALANVVVTSTTPDVERQLKADNEDAFVYLAGSVAKRMFARDGVERRILLGIIIRWICIVRLF